MLFYIMFYKDDYFNIKTIFKNFPFYEVALYIKYIFIHINLLLQNICFIFVNFFLLYVYFLFIIHDLKIRKKRKLKLII